MRFLKSLVLSMAVTCVAAAAFFAIGALAVWKVARVPEEPLQTVIVTVLAVAAVFLGSFLGAAAAGERGLLLGAACGAAAALCLGAISLGAGGSISPAGWARLAALLLGGCAGGVVGVNRRPRMKF